MRFLLLICAALLLTGCPSRPEARPETPVPPPPAAAAPVPEPAPSPAAVTPVPVAPPPAAHTPLQAFTGFINALEAQHPEQAWELLSTPVQQALAVSPEQFATGLFPEMRRNFLGLEQYQVVLEEQVDEHLAVVAIMGDRAEEGQTAIFRDVVLAVPLVQEQGEWRLSIGAGPRISAASPPAYAAVPTNQTEMAFYASSNSAVELVRLWYDGRDVTPQDEPLGVPELMVKAQRPEPLSAGTHTVVGLASDTYGNPSALGWSFKVE